MSSSTHLLRSVFSSPSMFMLVNTRYRPEWNGIEGTPKVRLELDRVRQSIVGSRSNLPRKVPSLTASSQKLSCGPFVYHVEVKIASMYALVWQPQTDWEECRRCQMNPRCKESRRCKNIPRCPRRMGLCTHKQNCEHSVASEQDRPSERARRCEPDAVALQGLRALLADRTRVMAFQQCYFADGEVVAALEVKLKDTAAEQQAICKQYINSVVSTRRN